MRARPSRVCVARERPRSVTARLSTPPPHHTPTLTSARAPNAAGLDARCRAPPFRRILLSSGLSQCHALVPPRRAAGDNAEAEQIEQQDEVLRFASMPGDNSLGHQIESMVHFYADAERCKTKYAPLVAFQSS